MDKQFVEGLIIKEKTINGSNGQFRVMNVSINMEKFVEQLNLIQNNGWANICIKARREMSEKGVTHYAEVDTWQKNEPTGEDASYEEKQLAPTQDKEEIDINDIPF